MIEKAAFQDYARIVWRIYCERRGAELPEATPAEWAMMRAWYERDYPVRVVAQAMRQTRGTPRSLLYFRHPVVLEAVRVLRAGTV